MYRLRVFLVVLLSSASFLLVSLSTSAWQAFFGVVFAALSGGLGEVTFLQYSAKYHKLVLQQNSFNETNLARLHTGMWFQLGHLELADLVSLAHFLLPP